MASVSSRSVAASVKNKAFALSESQLAKAPESVLAVGSTIRYGQQGQSEEYGSVIRPLGCSRRVYLTKPQFDRPKDMWGLSHRLRILSKNTSLNSILLGSTVPLTRDESQHSSNDSIYELPEMVRQLERIDTHHISYDTMPLANDDTEEERLLHSGIQNNTNTNKVVEEALDGIQHLALSMRGGTFDDDNTNSDASATTSSTGSKIPIISVVDGGLVNGGYALAMGSYVLATQQSSFRMTYPLQGLAMDPIGFSYMLPRLAEHNRVVARFADTAGLLLSLCGYTANAQDMVETGLATHYMESMGKLATLERALSEILPYDQQGILDTPIRTYQGPPTNSNSTNLSTNTTNNNNNNNNFDEEEEDINAEFRNVAVANLMHAIGTYDAEGQELGHHWTDEREFYNHRDDPSLYFGDHVHQELHQDRTSTLIDVASTLHPIVTEETSVEGIMDRFQQVIADCQTNIANNATNANDAADEKECMHHVQSLLHHMQSSSPLALRAIYRLHQVGKDSAETFQSCMAREKSVQLKLYQHTDYQTKQWKHATVQDVTDDEVEELL